MRTLKQHLDEQEKNYSYDWIFKAVKEWLQEHETINITQWQNPTKEFHILDKDELIEELEE